MSEKKDGKITDDTADFIAKAVKRFNKASQKEATDRQKASEDIKFKNGDQWPEQIRATRTIEKRPCLTINKMKTFVHQITNDQRQNRPAINISPVGDRGDPETAKMLKGLIRQIERQSAADIAYDTGFDSAVSMGWGYWRVITDWEDEDSFNQVIKIQRVANPFSVYMDPDTEMPDGSDARWVFISDLILRDDFEDLYPDSDPMPWGEGGMGDMYKDWLTPTHIRVAEYFYEDVEVKRLVALNSGHVGFYDDLDDKIKAQVDKDPEGQIKDEREVRCKYIRWCKLTAKEILEENDWAGSYIPVVKVIGDETIIDGKATYAGLIRDAKDAQRMYNFWVTSETELIALAPKAPWVMEEGQIEGHEQRWKDSNVKSLPYLLYKGTNIAGKPSPPPQRQQFAGPPAGVVQAKIAAAQDMQATTGIRFDATLQERNYDESGKALRELKRVGDLGNFHYIDNLSRSLRYTGKIFIDLIPKIYDTPRVLTILREDGSEERVKIDPQQGKSYHRQQGQDGNVERIYNPKLGQYDVAVTIGPSFATKRAEAADSMLQFLKVVPQSAPMVADLIAKNMDWPGAEEIYTRLASTLPPQMLNKQMEHLPPEAKAIVMNLSTAMQKLQAEHKQALAMLGDKEKDREIERASVINDKQKIEKDFEAKMAKVLADFEAKMAAVQAKGAEQVQDTSAKDQAEMDIKMAKVTADFEAKLIKIMADMDAQRMKHEAALQATEAKAATAVHATQQKTEVAEKGMRRQADMEKFEKLHDKISEKIAGLEQEIKGMGDMEVIFERDPKTNRIAKARKVKSGSARK